MTRLYTLIYLLCFNILLSTDCVVINEIHYNPDVDQNQYNSVGQYNLAWDTSNYASGTYIALINNSQQSIVKKLTLIK